MAMTPAPPLRDPLSTPELPDDVWRQIFMRLPPGDPKALVRAAVVCSSWGDILSDDAFACDYRKLHGAPPMLGFLYEQLNTPVSPCHERYWVSRFVSTATFRPQACQDRPYWHVLDSRHGLVLFYTPRVKRADFVVYDLVTGKQWKIQADRKFGDILWWEWSEEDKKLDRIRCNAVFCANDRCDHLDCHGGPFCIALVGSVEDGSAARATVYTSMTRQWSDIIEVQTSYYIEEEGHIAVVGNKFYVPCAESDSVVEYNMDEQKLSVIDGPDMNHRSSIYAVGVEDGMPLFASVIKPRLYLWSMDVGPIGAVVWTRHRIIELEPLLPRDVVSDLCYMSLAGFAEGVSVIFLSTKHGLYTIDLNSGKSKKVHQRQIAKVMPYMSFYTGAWWLPISHRASRAVVGATTT